MKEISNIEKKGFTVNIKDIIKSRNLFNVVNTLFLILVAALILLPLWMVVVTSLSSDEAVLDKSYILLPTTIDFKSYIQIFNSGYVDALLNSLIVMISAAIVSMALTVTLGYALSQKKLLWRGFFINFVLITMVLDSGIIPFYIVVNKLGMIDSYSSLIIPSAVSTYNLLLVRNYMSSIPKSIMESARLDGCSEFRILIKIVLPISLPIIAAITLFYAVTHWNQYLYVIMFINDTRKYTIQVLLRQLIYQSESAISSTMALNNFKMAVMIMTMLPVLVLYPFIQRYFISGIMLGSIKE